MADRKRGTGTLSPDEVRRILGAERERILRDLADLAERDEKRRQDEAARRRRDQARIASLLREGRELGIPVVELAKTIGVTRQMAHRLIRDIEHEKLDEKEGRDA